MGGNEEKWGKMGKNKETWVVQPVPFPPISSPFPPHGWGKIGLRGGGGGGGSLEPLSQTPPLLGSRDGALKKVIDGGK